MAKVQYEAFKSDGIWSYFLRMKIDDKFGEKAKCIKCSKVYACTGGSTKGLHDHLQSVHGINLRATKRPAESDTADNANAVPLKKAVGPMSKFVARNVEHSLQAAIARMVACDGLPFRVFITSPDIRKGLEAQGFSPLPKSKETIKKMVMDHGRTIQAFVCSEIEQRKKTGTRFSLTFDEWISTRNRRYMNINVHVAGGEFWSLGMIRVHGAMPAEKCVTLLEAKLADFGLSPKHDVVAICTDGASVMKKVGALIAAEQQLCYAHGIQLAVLDVLYKRSGKSRPTSAQEVEQLELEDSQSGMESSDDEDDGDDNSVEFELINDADDLITELSDSYQELVSKVRKIVKMFRRSPTKNDAVLQKYVKAEIGHELSLSLDSKTRWRSLHDMLSRFVTLRSCILKSMIDVKSTVQLTDGEIDTIQEIVSALEPVKLAVEALCRRDVHLVTADTVIKFAVVTLEKQSSELARTLAAAIRARVAERRNNCAGTLLYLSNPNVTAIDDPFNMPKNATIRHLIQALLLRLDHSDHSESASATTTEGTDSAAAQATDGDADADEGGTHPGEKELTLKEQLEELLKESQSTTKTVLQGQPADVEKTMTSAIKAEMKLFANTGNRGRCLEKAYSYLTSIPATSVEAERAFSAAGVLCTKLRSRLNDRSIDTMCFLRAYYSKCRT